MFKIAFRLLVCSLRRKDMTALSYVKRIAGKDKVPQNENVSNYVKEQINFMLHSPKLRELVERVSFREDISKDRVLRSILEKMSIETEQISKKTISI